MKNWLQRLSIIVFSIILSLFALETVLQLISTSYDSYIAIGEKILRLNPNDYRAHLFETAMTNLNTTGVFANPPVVYDPHTGWRPKYNSHNALYTWNDAGIRSQIEYELIPEFDTLRIALFGDSFMVGWEVFDDETIGYYLEQTLLERGIKAEVLNFGYGGYGMDQAYLRWKYYGSVYNSDIVIFGFQPENMFRNFNIFRNIYAPFGVSSPFTKPRFVLDEAANLHIINHPALKPEEGLAAYRDLENHHLLNFEDYYDFEYSEKWWLRSKIALLIYQNYLLSESREVEPKHMNLAQAIIRQFAEEVEDHNSKFMIVYLPNRPSIDASLRQESLPFQALLDQLKKSHYFIDSAPSLRLMNGGYWAVGGHYAPANNRAVAYTIADSLDNCLENGNCVPRRFIKSDLPNDSHDE